MKTRILAYVLCVLMLVSMIPVSVSAADPVATLNGTSFDTIQAAVNAAVAGDNVITLAATQITEEKVVITQKEGVNITIRGSVNAGVQTTFTGLMVVFGNGTGVNRTETLSIENITFDAKGGSNVQYSACILSPDRAHTPLLVGGPKAYSYSHNVTVKNCTFKYSGGDGKEVAAIRHSDGGDKNWLVKGCVVESTMHSLLQINNTNPLVVDSCFIYSSEGINLNQTEDATIQNCHFEVDGYAVRTGAKSGGDDVPENIEITGNTIKSGEAAIVVRQTSGLATLELAGNTVTTPDGVPAIDVSGALASGSTPTVTESTTTPNSYNGSTTPVVTGYKALLNGTYYSTVADALAVATSGDVVTLLAGEHDAFTVPKTANGITIKGTLAADGTKLTTINTNKDVLQHSRISGVYVMADGVIFKDLKFSSGTTNKFWIDGAITTNNSAPGNFKSLTVQNCDFVGSGVGLAIGVPIGSCTGITVTNTTITNYKKGVYAYGLTDGATLTITDSVINATSNSVHVEGSTATSKVDVSGTTLEAPYCTVGGSAVFTIDESALVGATLWLKSGTATITSSKLIDCDYYINSDGKIVLGNTADTANYISDPDALNNAANSGVDVGPLFPYYRDEAMTSLVSTPAQAADAILNDTYAYSTFEAALAAAKAGDVIKLNPGTYEPLTINKGVTVTAADPANKPIIKVNSKAESRTYPSPVNIECDGIIVMAENVTLDNLIIHDYGFNTNSSWSQSSVSQWWAAAPSVKGLKITNCEFYAKGSVRPNYACGITTPELTFSNNTVIGYKNAMFMMGDNTKLENVAITGNTFGVYDAVLDESYFGVTGGAGVMTITDNTILAGFSNLFELQDQSAQLGKAPAFTTLTIEDNGDVQVKLIYFAPSTTIVADEDVTFLAATNAEASINGTSNFVTFAEALAAAQPGDTIKLLKSVRLDTALDIQKSVIIDLGGFTMKLNAPDNKFWKGANVTIKNGTIDFSNVNSNGDGIILVGYYNATASTLTLDGVTVLANNYGGAYGAFYVYNTGGANNKLIIKNSNLSMSGELDGGSAAFKGNGKEGKVEIINSRLDFDNVVCAFHNLDLTVTDSEINIKNCNQRGMSLYAADFTFNNSTVTLTNNATDIIFMDDKCINLVNGAQLIFDTYAIDNRYDSDNSLAGKTITDLIPDGLVFHNGKFYAPAFAPEFKLTAKTTANGTKTDVLLTVTTNIDVAALANLTVVCDDANIAVTRIDNYNWTATLPDLTEGYTFTAMLTEGAAGYGNPTSSVTLNIKKEDPGIDNVWMSVLMRRYNTNYDILVVADEGAEVTNAGVNKVQYKKSLTVEITAKDGYTVTDVLVNGKSVGVVDSYTFRNVKDEYVLEVVTAKVAP